MPHTGNPLSPLDARVHDRTARDRKRLRLLDDRRAPDAVVNEDPEKAANRRKEEDRIEHRNLGGRASDNVFEGGRCALTLLEHRKSAYMRSCMTISIAQRLRAPTTRIMASMTTHLVWFQP